MFTGIIETLGTIKKIEQDKSNLHFYIESAISNELKIDQSVSHNGVCLTVVELDGSVHKVTENRETLTKSNLGDLRVGDLVNLERGSPAGGISDGHSGQGHVDQTSRCISKEDQDRSRLFTFDN